MATRAPGGGRKPKPTALRLLDGNPGKRPINKDEPKPRPGTPTCPFHNGKDPEACRAWHRLVKELAPSGLATMMDADALALLCQEMARKWDAEDKLRQYGVVISEMGRPRLSPYYRIANDAAANIKALLAEFGLTPASRSRIHAQPPKEEQDPMEALRANGNRRTG